MYVKTKHQTWLHSIWVRLSCHTSYLYYTLTLLSELNLWLKCFLHIGSMQPFPFLSNLRYLEKPIKTLPTYFQQCKSDPAKCFIRRLPQSCQNKELLTTCHYVSSCSHNFSRHFYTWTQCELFFTNITLYEETHMMFCWLTTLTKQVTSYYK